MIKLNLGSMKSKLDLEIRIYWILSDEKGHSHGDLARIIGKDDENTAVRLKGNISSKLKDLRKKGYLYCKEEKMPNRDQDWCQYWIKNDFDVFTHILTKITNDLDIAPKIIGSKDLNWISENSDKLGITFEQNCSLIRKFIGSEYTFKIIQTFGFEKTYLAFKKAVRGYHCGENPFMDHALKMIDNGTATSLDMIGKEFMQDLEDQAKSAEIFCRNYSPKL
jgi:hypothetical protein